MNSMHDHAFAVILAGGSGTRLWPKSRDNTPKQFLKLGGDRTLLQQTADRVLNMIPWERVIVVTNARYVDEVRRQLPQVPGANVIAEPEKRDTALAMGLGAVIAKQRDPDAVVVNMASDHVLQDVEGYRKVISAAIELASQKQHLITVGITPTEPNVNFGYIKAGNQISEINGYQVQEVLSFKEKPDAATAEQFLSEGNYFWNANMYTWHVDAALAAFQQHQPEMYAQLERMRAAVDTPQFEQVLATEYASAQKVAIDVAISEKANNLALLPGNFGWDDIGLWSTVYELGQKDSDGTVVVREGEEVTPIVSLDAKNNLVATNKRLVALVGVEDLVVIDSTDVILVLPRSRAADVKKIVQQLEAGEDVMKQYL